MEPYTSPSSSESTSTTVKDENHHTTLDILNHDDDEIRPCSPDDETSMEEENEEEVLSEMINVGLQKFVITNKDFARSKSWSICIYKVEQNLKKVHEKSTFHPKLISIGPFHHNKSEHLKLMEQHKWRFFSDFLKSMKPTHINNSLHQQFLVDAVKKLEAETRDCYSETFDDLGSNEFVQMMLLDGCFIIQLLLLFQKSGRNCRNDVDSIFSWRSRLPHLRHDLLLLENQLPFFVLQKIFEISGLDNYETYKLRDLILDFFNPVLSREKKVLDQCKQATDSRRYHHLFELFMKSFSCLRDQTTTQCHSMSGTSYYPEVIPNDGRDQDMSIHCVTELREAGIEFKKIDDHHDLLDIKFKNGSLHIPTLFIDGNTVPVLLNFIAYEQRHHHGIKPFHHEIKPYFTSYLMFLDNLVNSSKDVEHLHYKGIINHGFGSDEEVAALLNKLCKEVVQDLGDNNYLSPVLKDVNKYFGKRRNRWRAAWKHEYFRTPWAFSSFLAAIVLIVLTFLQTYFSMYAYFRPPSN